MARIAGIDFSQDALAVAPQLIGLELLVDGVGGLIVETEAYDQFDEASHTYGGLSARNASMFGEPGHAYVYRSYGMHWCLNFVCREAGHGAGVLIRALQPTQGLARMRERRGLDQERLLCAGPGRLAQALGVTRTLDGCALARAPFALRSGQADGPIACGPRIGISRARERPWRFGLAGSPYLSRALR